MTTVQRKTDRVAIASLVLCMIPNVIMFFRVIVPLEFIPVVVPVTIFSLVLISAVICGHVARSRIKKNPDTLTGNGIALAGLVIGYAILALMLAPIVFRSYIEKVQEEARYINCMSNHRYIYKAATEWSHNHSNSFPPTLQTLVNEGRVYTGALICPCSGRGMPCSTSQVDQWSDYIIVSNRNLDDGQAVLIYEKPDCHKGKGGNVTLVNGSSIWCNADEYGRRTDGLKH